VGTIECGRKLNTVHRAVGDCTADLVDERIQTIAPFPGRRFQLSGSAGLTLAVMLTMILTRHTGLSYWVMAGLVGTAIATFLALVMATKIVAGEERLIYYHHEIAVMIMAALFLSAIHKPLLPYLDITILGIGTFLTCGRIGCLMVGCCHGRPHRWGIRYSEEHAAAGFPSYLVGVRLFPIQAVESFLVLGTVVVGTYFVWSGQQPGTSLAWYVVTYDAGRFAFEFARGDADRPYWVGFSQAQWLALLLTGGVVWAELAARLTLSRWHLAIFAFLVASMLATSLRRRLQRMPDFQLLHPRHIRQVAGAMKSVCTSNDSSDVHPRGEATVVRIACTSLGIQISGDEIHCATERIFHYTLSCRDEPMTERAAKVVASLIRRLNGVAGSEKLVTGTQGVFHFLICAPAVAGL